MDFQASKRSASISLIVSILALCISAGLIALIEHSFLKGNPARRTSAALTRALWKFESADATLLRMGDMKWSWRKLILAGTMISTLIFSVSAKLVSIPLSLGLACVINALWTIFLLIYWHMVVLPSLDSSLGENNNKNDKAKEAISSGMFTKAEGRLAVTIITGFLGSGE